MVEMSNKYSRDGSGIGPQCGSDDAFTRRMRLHQSWYRDRVLRVPYGTGPDSGFKTFFGNMLTEKSANAGLNFLSPGIFAMAKQRIGEGGSGVQSFRLLRNMLSSQPMCFNLFGELALDLGNATELVQTLWGASVSHVMCIRFEWVPKPAAEYLGDRTTFDAFIEYETDDGQMGFIGIETKLSEPFSQEKYDRREYRRWMTNDAPWRADAGRPSVLDEAQPALARSSARMGRVAASQFQVCGGRTDRRVPPRRSRLLERNRRIPWTPARRGNVFRVRSGHRGGRLEANGRRMAVEVRTTVPDTGEQ